MIAERRLPVGLFHDLLSAFAQDVTKKHYTDLADVLDYCRRSANPVGRLLLVLYGAATPQNNAWSDSICSALQIINFLQDIAIDYANRRIYMPQDELARHQIGEAQFAAQTVDAAWRDFMAFQVGRTRAMLLAGAPLGRVLDRTHRPRNAHDHRRRRAHPAQNRNCGLRRVSAAARATLARLGIDVGPHFHSPALISHP